MKDMDINTKGLKKNAFRVTKKRNLTAARIRVPGGHLNVKFLPVLQEIAEKYGNGTLHVRKPETTQGKTQYDGVLLYASRSAKLRCLLIAGRTEHV